MISTGSTWWWTSTAIVAGVGEVSAEPAFVVDLDD
jgi:hypothetical protein